MTVSRVPNVEGGIQPTIVTAKGDLITAVANANPARLGVGSDGQLLTADSTTATGLSYQSNFAAGKNKIINGDFGIWQRGTSFSLSNSSSSYTADRWRIQANFSSGTVTASRQAFTPGTAPVAGYEGSFFLQVANSAGSTDTQFEQRIEDVRTFAGQTVTLSFWAKATSSVTMANTIGQSFGTGGSSAVFTTGTSQTITTSWARYSTTITLPSIAGKTIGTDSSLQVYPMYYSSGTIASNTISIWGVQLEAGSNATAFQTATGTIQGELAACQRYYWRGSGASSFATYGLGYASSTTSAVISIPLLQTMRIQPSSVDYASLFLSDGSGSPAISAITIGSYSTNTVRLTVTTTGATQFRPYSLMNAGTTAGFIAFIAEL